MFKWLRNRKAKIDPALKMVDIKSLGIKTDPTLTGTVTIPSSIINSGYVYAPNLTSAATIKSNNVTTFLVGQNVNTGVGTGIAAGGMIGGHFPFPSTTHQAAVSINSNSREIVRITKDGKVEWPNGVEIDEAAKALSQSLTIGIEMCAGITANVKQDIRDIIFQDLIDMANQKGNLTAEDLTYMWQSAKIMDKLKGVI